MEYFLDNGKPTHFLSKRQVNLLVGASGAGKTTLLFQLYKASVTGEPFLGMHCPPIKWAYISGDRTRESIEATMERVGVTGLPIFSMVDENMIGDSITKKIIPLLPKRLGFRPELIMIDGFSGMVPDGKFNDYFAVCQWLGGLQRYCTRQDLSFLGVTHVSKIREGSQTLDPRQQAMGSNAFAGYTEDQIVINRIYKKGQQDLREIWILPRNGPERKLRATFEDGIIVPDFSEEKRQEEKATGVGFVLEALLTPGAKFESVQMEQQAKTKGVSRATFYRWLNKLVKEGRLAKEVHGEYRVMASEAEDIFSTYAIRKQSEANGEAVERGGDVSGAEEVRKSQAESEVRPVHGSGILLPAEGDQPIDQEDSIGGDAVADSEAAEAGSDSGGGE